MSKADKMFKELFYDKIGKNDYITYEIDGMNQDFIELKFNEKSLTFQKRYQKNWESADIDM